MLEQALSPFERYQKDIKENEFTSDDAQLFAINKLDVLFHELIKRNQKPQGFLKHLFRQQASPIKG
jgi:cell division protein ZapE